MEIKHHVSSVEHPQTNGQAKAANKVIIREMRKKLGMKKGLWAEEIPCILWDTIAHPSPPWRKRLFASPMG